jgi:hypothetical protein
MDTERNKITKYIVRMTAEQKEITEGIFNFHGWDIDIQSDSDSEDSNFCLQEDEGHTHTCVNIQDENKNETAENSGANIYEENIIAEQESTSNIQLATNEAEGCEGVCVHCFNNSCVTSNPQAWLGGGRTARAGNNIIRKRLYRKYWTMLDRRGLWNLPAYLLRKEKAMREANIQLTQREIIPDCVLYQVRNLYPNPKDVPYMGHHW